jgi:hypothetical protein
MKNPGEATRVKYYIDGIFRVLKLVVMEYYAFFITPGLYISYMITV